LHSLGKVGGIGVLTVSALYMKEHIHVLAVRNIDGTGESCSGTRPITMQVVVID